MIKYIFKFIDTTYKYVLQNHIISDVSYGDRFPEIVAIFDNVFLLVRSRAIGKVA